MCGIGGWSDRTLRDAQYFNDNGCASVASFGRERLYLCDDVEGPSGAMQWSCNATAVYVLDFDSPVCQGTPFAHQVDYAFDACISNDLQVASVYESRHCQGQAWRRPLRRAPQRDTPLFAEA